MGIGIAVGWHLFRKLLQLTRDTRTARLAKCFIYKQSNVGVSFKFTALFYNVIHRQTFNEFCRFADCMTNLRALLLGGGKNCEILSKTSKYELFILHQISPFLLCM